jgi:hypothetical protein
MTCTRKSFAIITTLLVILLCGAEARDFPLASCKGANGTITELFGIDTDHARMIGVVTIPDAIEYCVRQVSGRPGSRETHDQCAQEVLRAENGARYYAEANCPKRVLRSKTDQSAKAIEQLTLVCGKDSCTWRSNLTGKMLGDSCADGTPPLFLQFEILCPTEAEGLPLNR